MITSRTTLSSFSRRSVQVHTSIRFASTAVHFYQNKQLELYASKEANRLTLRQLVFRFCFLLYADIS